MLNSTIFKTFDSNIDKSIAKIGMFNKSFWAMQQDLKHDKGLFFSIFGGQSVTDSDKQAILDLNAQLKNGIKPAKAWATTMTNCTIAAQNQARQCLKTKGDLVTLANGLDTMSASAKAGKVALNALAAVGNMFIGWAISKAIELVIQGISKLINYQDDLIEKSKEAIRAFEEAGNSLRSNKETIEDITSDYTKLSQGVDSLGRNVSLNTEEYKRYNEIVNKIADMFPQMVQGYTDEGNAIIANKGNVEELTKAYEEQKQAYQDLIITKSAETYAGYKAQVVETPWTESIKGKHGTYSYIEQKEAIDDLIEALGKGKEAFEDFYSNSYIGTASNGMDYYSILQSALGEIGFDFGGVMNVDERFEKWKSQLETKIVSYQRDLTNKINAETAQVKPILTAFIEQSSDYQNLNPKIQDMKK